MTFKQNYQANVFFKVVKYDYENFQNTHYKVIYPKTLNSEPNNN